MGTPFGQAMELYREHELPKAAAKFKDATELSSSDAAALAWLARLQLMLWDPGGAAVSADKAIRLDRNLPTAQSAMAEVFYRQGKLAEAQEIFRAIVLADKPDARAYLGLAKIHWATGNYKSAKQVIDHAHNLDPKDPEIFWRWYATLGVPEQRTALLEALASVSNPGANQTAQLKRAVDVLDEREKRPPSGCKLVSPVSSTEIQMGMLSNGPNNWHGFEIPAKLNDVKVTLRIGTASEAITISARAAERAGLQRLPENRFTGVRNFKQLPANRGYVDTITLGDLQFKNCYVSVVEHLQFEGADGLIGTNLLEDFLVDLDFPDKMLRLSPLAPLPDLPPVELALHSEMPIKPDPHNRIVPEKYASFTKVFRVGRDLLIPTQVNDSQPQLFLLDATGWDSMIASGLAKKVSKVSETRFKNLYTTEELTLRFGEFRAQPLRLFATDLKHFSDDAETEISGILGFAFLSVLDINLDYRDHLVRFQPALNGSH